MKIRNFIRLFQNDIGGASAIEYGLLLSLVVIMLIVGLNALAGQTLEMWSHVETESAKAHKSN